MTGEWKEIILIPIYKNKWVLKYVGETDWVTFKNDNAAQFRFMPGRSNLEAIYLLRRHIKIQIEDISS